MDPFLFAITTLAVWRVTHLFTKEDGPFEIIYRIRRKAGAGFFGSLLDCFYCTSIWIAAPPGFWLGHGWMGKMLLWLAFSGAVCLLEQATGSKNKGDGVPDYNED